MTSEAGVDQANTITGAQARRSAGVALRMVGGVLSARKWQIGGGLVLVAALAWAFARWFFGPEVVVYPVVRADLVRSVVASGHVETPFRVEIASQITWPVRRS